MIRLKKSVCDKYFIMKVWCTLFGLVVGIKAMVDYHEKIGIPRAARIKKYEDNLFAEESKKDPRNVGGDIAPVFAHPYLAGLLIRLESKFLSMCCSALISPDRLVTAAHCLAYASSMKVVMGTPYLYRGGTRIITRQFVMHPRFNPESDNRKNYDIGVVKLPEAVETSGTLHLIRLPRDAVDAEKLGEWATAPGWGITSDDQRGKQATSNLIAHEVNVRVIAEDSCVANYSTITVAGSIVCTDGVGREQQPVGACDGDSGGPLVVERERKKMLIGIVSHGGDICNATLPTVYSKTLFYRNFILNASLFP